MVVRWCFVLLFAIGAWCGMEATARAAQKQKMVLKNGSVLIGEIVKMDENTVVFRTPQGTLNIKRQEIKSLAPVSAPAKRKDPSKQPHPDDDAPPGTEPAEPKKPVQPTEPIQPRTQYRQYQYNDRRRAPDSSAGRGFLIAGISTLVPGYALSFFLGGIGTLLSSGRLPEWYSLMIPVVGPFISLGIVAVKDSSNGAAAAAPLLVLGLLQSLGLTFIIIGATRKAPPRRVRVAGQSVPPPAPPAPRPQRTQRTPSFHSTFSF